MKELLKFIKGGIEKKNVDQLLLFCIAISVPTDNVRVQKAC